MMVKIFRYIYVAMSWIFVIGLIYQTYTAGLAAVSRTISWATHAGFGFLLLGAALLQLLLILPARMPRPAVWVSVGLFVTILLQVLVVSNRESPTSALHPVFALVSFSMALWLAAAAGRSVREPARRAPAPEGENE